MSKKEFISVREFARRVDVDESTVRGHIKAQRFINGYVADDKGRFKMDWTEAKKEWDSFGGGIDKDKKRTRKNAGPETKTPELTPSSAPGSDDDIPDINISKQKVEHFKALAAEVEYKKLIGDLVARADVDAALFEYGSNFRKAILSVPDLVVDEVMTHKTRQDVHAVIYNALEKELFKFVDADALDKRE